MFFTKVIQWEIYCQSQRLIQQNQGKTRVDPGDHPSKPPQMHVCFVLSHTSP